MASSGSSGRVAKEIVSTGNSTSVTIVNKVTGIATEVSEVLPSNTVEILVRARGSSKIQLTYTSSESGTKFVTIPKGVTYIDSNIHSTATIFFQTNIADTVEIVAYHIT